MNFEERLFFSMLSESNLKSELPYILEYFTKLYDLIVEVHRLKPSESLESGLILYITQRGLVIYFSTLLKKYHEKEEEEENKVKKEPM